MLVCYLLLSLRHHSSRLHHRPGEGWRDLEKAKTQPPKSPSPSLIPSSDSAGGLQRGTHRVANAASFPSSSMALAADAQFHVLAVDDSLLDRKFIERLLRTSSYQVTTVDSGSKALEFLGLRHAQSNSPSVSTYHQEIEVNLVITDYCMPGMTGYDLLKKIKETSSLKDIPVVIMSSENVPSRINRCLEEGAEEFFLKPVQKSDMERLIPHIMKRKSTELQKEGQLQEQEQEQEQEQPQQPPQLQPNNHNNLCTAITTDGNNINGGGGGSNNSTSSNSNKRKAVDEALSPERTRPRCTVTA